MIVNVGRGSRGIVRCLYVGNTTHVLIAIVAVVLNVYKFIAQRNIAYPNRAVLTAAARQVTAV